MTLNFESKGDVNIKLFLGLFFAVLRPLGVEVSGGETGRPV